MYKHSPSRNQRSKGIKVKHVLQICLLVAVCFWLIYQVKHSHDNKREFDDSAKNSLATEQKDGVVKLGRKDLKPRMEDKGIQTGKQDEEEEDEETAVEEEENKHEEMEEQDDNKTDEKEEEEEEDVDEGRGGGEEIDDNDQEKSDADNGQEVDFVDDEKEQENVDELELEDEDVEDNKGQTENDSASREQYKKGGMTNTRDAREENYNADDASSAVIHDTQIIATDNQTRITGKSNQRAEVREFEHQNQSINPDKTGAGKNPPVKVESGETANNGSYLSVTTIGQSETAIATLNGTEGSRGNKNRDNSTAVRIEPQELPLPRWNRTFSEHYEDVVEGHKNARNGSEFQIIDNKLEGNSTLPGSNDPHDFTSTINTDSKDTHPTLKESKKSDGTWSANVSTKTEEAFDDTKDNREDGIYEKLDESNSETLDELQVDPIDSSDTTNFMEERIFSNDL